MKAEHAMREAIIQQYIDAYNRKDVAGMLQHLHDNMQFENITDGVTDMLLIGKEAFAKQAETATHYVSERHQHAGAFTHHDGHTEIAITYHATAATGLSEKINQGNTINKKGRSVFYFADDKIIKIEDIV